MQKNANKNGFTLVETIVVVAIFSILALGVSAIFTHVFSSSRNRLASIDVIDQARLATTNFTNEIRVASVGVDGSFPIVTADSREIVFYTNYNQENGLVSKIRYYAATSTLYKSTIVPTGSPLSYNSANEKIKTVQTDLASTTEKIFYYYDGDFDGESSPLSEPVNVNDIKFVKINLNIIKKTSNTDTSSFNTSAGSSIRNLKDNLGN